MDVSQYLEIFIDETKEHLQSLNEQLLVLEQEPENQDTINEIFRAAHSLKGMAGTMGYKRMQRLTHDMENVFSEVRTGNMKIKSNLVDVLFRGLDALESYLANIQEHADEGTEDNEDIITDLNRILKEGVGGAEETAAPVQAAVAVSEAPKASNKKFNEMVLAEHEVHAVQKAKGENTNVFGLTVFISESCILKAARAFLVFKALEELGDVIKSNPVIQDIEDEKFEWDFSLIILTKEDIEKVRDVVASVSEIKEVDIEEYVLDADAAIVEDTLVEQAKTDIKEEKSEPVETQTLDKKEQDKEKQGKQQGKQQGKPVVNRSVRVDIEKLDVLMNLVSELIIAKNGLVSLNGTEREAKTVNGFNEQIEYLERVTTNLHESVMKVRMVPIESVVNRFPRMIRDLKKKLNKKMELYMTGEDTELDRTVIDEIGDPLMHLLRNSADHGIENNVEDRLKAGKPEVGSIFLDAYQDGNNVVIEVRDDGAGINVEKVKNKAIERGTITREQAETMKDKEIIDLLFLPSFSTAEVISDVSGRGVGLDVVKTNIEALGGNIEAKTTLGEGSNFIIRLPLTLAIIQALMVELGTEKYAIPLGSIETIEDVSYEDIKYVQNKEVINLRGTVIPLIRLDEVLDVELRENKPASLTVVIVKKGDDMAGLIVDNLIGQQEVVIKSLGKYIHNNKMISGASILGDGEVALILDANTFI